MAPKYQIAVDFDVDRESMLRREREDITFNDVLRGLLVLDRGRLRPETPPSGSDQRPKPVTVEYELRGCRVALDTAKAVLIGVLRELAQQDAQFPNWLAAIADGGDLEGGGLGLPAGRKPGGVLFAVNGSPWGIDLFDSPVTLGKTLPKLVRSYALDGIDVAMGQATPVLEQEALRFVTDMLAAR